MTDDYINYKITNLELLLQNREGLMKGYLVCDDCLLAKEDTVRTHCPYQKDVHNMIDKCNLCDTCYRARCDEI